MGSRLLILSPTPARGGAEEYLLTIAAAAEQQGWDVTASFELGAGTTSLARDVAELGRVRFLNMPIRGGRRWGVCGQTLATIAALVRARPAVVMIVGPWPTLMLGNVIAAALLRAPTAVVFQLAPVSGRGRPLEQVLPLGSGSAATVDHRLRSERRGDQIELPAERQRSADDLQRWARRTHAWG